MADSFHAYLKKQLLEYVAAERKKGIPLDAIEAALLNAGHEKNIIDEVVSELKKEEAGKKAPEPKGQAEKDLSVMLKGAFSQFMAQVNSEKEVKDAKKELGKEDTEKIVKEVIEEAEIIEEKTMLESAFFFIYLVALGAVMLFSAGATSSEIVSVFIGFIPAILNVFISFALLYLADNVPLYVLIPVGISSIFYAAGRFSGLPFFQGMEMEGLAVVNFLAGFIFNIGIVYLRFLKPRHMRKRVIKKNTKAGKGAKQDPPPTIEAHNAPNKETGHHAASYETYHRKERKEIKELKQEFNIKN